MAVTQSKKQDEIIDWTCTAIEAYVKTMRHKLFDSRMYIIKILDIISKYASYDKDNMIFKSFKSTFYNTQIWVWMFWFPQLLDFVLRTNSEHDVARLVLCEIAKLYPQPLFIALRTFYWYYSNNNKGKKAEIKQKVQILGKSLYNLLNDQYCSNPINNVIDVVIQELKKRFVFTTTSSFQAHYNEENMYDVIQKGYAMSFSSDFKAEKYFERLWQEFDKSKSEKPDFLSTTLREQFVKDFKEGNVESGKIATYPSYVYQEKLKKWKDILSRRLSLKFAPQNLVEISKKLANFNYRMGMELPGQYLEMDTEPFPEKRILISKFEPNISHNNKKRIIIRTNTGKRLTYSIVTNLKHQENATLTDEWITQFKVFMNKIFVYMNPETMRRGIRLGVFKKIIFPYTKLCEDNNINSFDEIYKIACAEFGIEPDTANCLFTRDIKEMLKDRTEEEKLNISDEDISKKVRQCNQYMRKLIDSNFLSSYFKSNSKTIDDYFMFRKQFSNYYATNSFLTYAFRLSENTLDNLKVCTRHGRVFHNESKMTIERKLTTDDVPFRLSDNIREFITDIGLNSLFPGVMTTCALAVHEKETYVRAFIKRIFLNLNLDDNVDGATEDIMARILSIAKPYFSKTSQLRYLAEENKEEVEEMIKKANEELKKDRFNKKAYDLIEEATDKKTLYAMNPCFVSWF